MTTLSNSKVSPFICLLILSLFLGAYFCNGMYVPGSYMHHYSQGDDIYVKVNSLTSVETQLPLDYYSLPYCKPSTGVRRSVENLGQLLMGDKIQNSPYRFWVNTNESLYLCTSSPLTKQEVELLKQRTNELYQVNLILDNLPVMRYNTYGSLQIRWTGSPIGFEQFPDGKDYIINHLKFRVLLHETRTTVRNSRESPASYEIVGYEIVGFEVTPRSVKRDAVAMSKLSMYDRISPTYSPTSLGESQAIEENERVTFTYEVEFGLSNITWPSRWEAYLETKGQEVHWFSLQNSVITILLFGGFLCFKISKMVAKCREGQPFISDVISRSELFMGDTFREPSCSKILCVMVGNGIQIAGMAIVTILFATLGFMSPSSRGDLLTGMIIHYILFGIVAGYVGVWLWRSIKGNSEGWSSVSWSTACFFSSIAFVIFAVLNIIHYVNGSTAAVSISVYFTLLALWLCVSVPLTLLGGFIAARSNEPIQFPVKISKNPREIVPRPLWSWLLVLVAGLLPFGTIFVEMFFIFSSIWLGRFYYAFGFLLMAALFLAIGCALVSVGQSCRCIATEDWKWGWKAFFASGSVGFYVFLYSMKYLVFDLVGLSGMASAALYLGYSMILALAIMLSTGAIGFLSAFGFLRYISFVEIF